MVRCAMVARAVRGCRVALWGAAALLASAVCPAGEVWPTVAEVDRQPLLAQAHRLVDALERLGSPLEDGVRQRLRELDSLGNDAAVTRGVEAILDPLCVMAVGVAKDGQPTSRTFSSSIVASSARFLSYSIFF